MTVPTCAVRAIVNDSVGGEPIEGAIVTATLSSFEIYEGYVVPQKVEAITDANGEATLDLWPNELGSVESYYDIKITGNGKSLKTTAVIPNLPAVDLHTVASLPPYEGQTDGAFVLAQVIEALTTAKGYRDDAQASEAAAGLSETAAAASAAAAAVSETAADLSALAAAASDAAAGASETNAAAHELAAQESATAAAGSQVAAAASADEAEDWAAAAQAAADSISSGPVTSVNTQTGVVVLNKTDIGLSNVENLAPADMPISTLTQGALDGKATNQALQAHIDDQANPHAVDKTDVGLGNVANLAPADLPVSTATQGALDLKSNTATTVTKDSATGAAQLPVGTTAQRPEPNKGSFRYNDNLGRYEGANGEAWGSLGGATGGGNDAVFYVNGQTVNSNYTIPAGQNAMSAGPITIADGVAVTISDGSVWTIV